MIAELVLAGLVPLILMAVSLGLARMKELAAIADGCSLEEGLRRELEIVADYAADLRARPRPTP